MATIRAKIDYAEFAALVDGHEVELAGWGEAGPVTVKLILADIGFAQMLVAIDLAIMAAKAKKTPSGS